MKIDKIYIKAFGGLKDYTLDFSDGFNIIYGDNENGKSTVMAFIKMMFYGSGRGVSKISKNPRLKYAPWSGERPAGRIYFEHGGTNYCLEREFMRSDNTDKVRLTNTDTGESLAVPSNVGLEFFSLGAAAFERTVFIASPGEFQTDEDANGEINSKLSNIALSGDEDISYQTVLNRIVEAKHKLMSKSGRAGRYDKDKMRLQELNLSLATAREAQERKGMLYSRLEEIKAQIAELSKEYAGLKRIVDSEKDILNRKKLSEYLSLKAELDRLNDDLRLNSGDLSDESFLKMVEFCLKKAEYTAEKIAEYSAEAEKISAEISLAENSDKDGLNSKKSALQNELTNMHAELSALSESIAEKADSENAARVSLLAAQRRKKPFSLPLLAVGILLALSAAGLLFVSREAAAATAAVGVISAVLSFVLRPLDKKAANAAQKELADLQNELSTLKEDENTANRRICEITEELNRIITAISTDHSAVEHKKLALAELDEKLKTKKDDYMNECEEALNLFGKYRTVSGIDEINRLLPQLKSAADTQKQLKLKLKYISDDLGGISYSEAEKKLAELSGEAADALPDFEANRQKLQETGEKITALKSEFSAVSTEINTAFRQMPDSDSLEKEISGLERSLESQKYFCEIADIAAAGLEKSFAEVRRSYGSALERRALDIFSSLTDNAYSGMGISKSLDITVEKKNDFGMREIDYLSSGTADQAYLSLRLALCELITDKEPLPLFLDDLLCQYDDKRAKATLDFLKQFSADRQIILFTCHNSFCDMAKSLVSFVGKI